jgi:hypothetical protein
LGALIPFVGNGLPASRRALCDLQDRLFAAEKQLARLRSGAVALASELARAMEAKAELRDIVEDQAKGLAERLRDGAQWPLSSYSNARARELSASLSESRIQASVGERALESVAEEISALEREVADMRASKGDLVRSVLIESASGFRSDMLTAIDQLHEAMVILAALDKITARSDGSYAVDERIVIETPPLGGLPAQACAVPAASVEVAMRIWGKYAQAVADNPLASADELKFPAVDPHADDGLVSYDRLSRTEKIRVDQNRAQGI